LTEKSGAAKQVATALGILSIVLAVIVMLLAMGIIPAVNSNRAPRLVNVGVGGYDIPDQHVLRINGYVCNVGVDTAYHTQIHVRALYETGGVAIDTWVDIGNGGVIYGAESTQVKVDVGYSGSASGLGSWTMEPMWSTTQ
jgi:hypothetical protein